MAEEELRELAEINLSHQYGGGRWGSGGGGPEGGGAWGRSPGGGGSLSHHRAQPLPGGHGGAHQRAAEAEDIVGGRGPAGFGGGGPRGTGGGRPGLYYSPPGTSYTIVERPPAPRGTYLGPSPASASSASPLAAAPSSTAVQRPATGKKRPISPEQVLKMLGGHLPPSDDDVKPPPRRPSPGPRVDPRTLPVRTVSMSRGADPNHGFGICVKGGSKDQDSETEGVGVYISRVEEGSVAERVGLRPGDSILEVNGTPFTSISHEDALKEFEAGFTRATDAPRAGKQRTTPSDEEITKMLKSCRQLSMTVRSAHPPASPPPGAGGAAAAAVNAGQWLVRQTYSWMDRQGRPVSPPPEYAQASPPPPPLTLNPHTTPPRWNNYPPRTSKEKFIRKVDLSIEPGQSLGLMIRGGIEYNLGIFITGVDKDSVADRAGLLIGDQILEVNGQSFMDVSHDEAVNQLKLHKRMTVIVRDVGKVPNSCTAYDQDPWDATQGSSRVGRSAALQMVDEKARCVLTKAEFAKLSYYLDEYSARQMAIDAFVAVLLELLNTPDKYTLLTELREVVAPEDRAHFDELVYRRESEGQRLQHLLDPRHVTRRKGGGNPISCCDNNHATLMSSLHDLPGAPEHFSTSRPCKFPPSATGEACTEPEDFRTPSEDSGLGLGPEIPLGRSYGGESPRWYANSLPKRNDLALSGDEEFHKMFPGWESRVDGGFDYGGDMDLTHRRHSSVSQLNQSSYDEANMRDGYKCGYFEGLRSHLGGWTQKVKSWYWGNPLVS
ncbi:uncharacterized protein LOC111064115 isoform X3 [Nilaparvata lugens]|uniref:uncharacterized protein LOC111064115 isoform X3 n=1 Tax=Nilaparvata lugens TaxID=108931 RepID=UPI00193D1800|nr:uncharacterized protein LOC111064115 isoform X3 [Nilaparvata lugens]